MITFVLLCIAMTILAIVLVARPLLKGPHSVATVAVVAAFLLFVSAGIYFGVGHTNWERDQANSSSALAAQKDLAANIARLEQVVRERPNDTDALMNLAEALVEQDERSLGGRAGELFELILERAPENPKALWFGAIGALSNGKLAVARDRMQRILAQNPPDNIRSIIERQIQDIGQQLGEQKAPVAGPSLDIQVSIAPEFAKTLDKSTSLFLLARDPVKGGPPLAVTRRTVSDLPLHVVFSDADAMMAGRGISSAKRVQVVARVSKSGAPQSQVGDYFGEAMVELDGKGAVAVKISIDQKVEK